MNKSLLTTILGLLAIPLVLLLLLSMYTVNEGEQAIITEFGRPVREVSDAGLHFKKPFIQTVNRIERRVLEWDGRATEMPTRDKVFIIVDTYGRWRIKDPLQYFQRLRDETTAQSRLDDILASETRNTIARHDLIEVVRSTKDRVPQVDTTLVELLTDDVPLPDDLAESDDSPAATDDDLPAPLVADSTIGLPTLYPITRGRTELEQDIFEEAAPKLEEFGIELLDVRFKRVNYSAQVSSSIYERMISERNQIAERFRSQGEGAAARIIGEKERELRRIQSEAYRQVQEIRGGADAEATNIFANAYDRSGGTRDFYMFLRTLEAYEDMFDHQTTMVLSTDTPLFNMFKTLSPAPVDLLAEDPEDVHTPLPPVSSDDFLPDPDPEPEPEPEPDPSDPSDPADQPAPSDPEPATTPQAESETPEADDPDPAPDATPEPDTDATPETNDPEPDSDPEA